MHVAITGGAGVLGQKLARRLLAGARLAGPDGPSHVSRLTLFDVAEPAPDIAADPKVRIVTGDVGDAGTVARAVPGDVASVFHLAAVVSAAAEADFDLGMRVNLGGTRNLLEACRGLPRPPRLVFASSIAAYGGALPETIGDDTGLTPQTSYGTQKAMGELLVNDMSRKDFVDGRALRLPTVVVRPGRPNRAASTWASSIVREPLQGEDAVCPVSPGTKMYIASPRTVVECLVHGHDLPAGRLGANRSVLLPGLTADVTEMLAGLERAGGRAAVARVRFERDEAIQRIVSGWAAQADAARARDLGFPCDESYDALVQAFIEDDLRRA